MCELSSREKEVCNYIIEGLSLNEIAKKMYIEVCTVKTHLNNLYKKLGIKGDKQNRRAMMVKYFYDKFLLKLYVEMISRRKK